jgi:hypothetical protein
MSELIFSYPTQPTHLESDDCRALQWYRRGSERRPHRRILPRGCGTLTHDRFQTTNSRSPRTCKGEGRLPWD